MIVAADAAAWMVLTWAAAMSGILQQWDLRPPPFLFVILGTIVISLILALGGVPARASRSTPLWALVAIQGFRLPAELAMHALSERGIMPIQHELLGRNFDIATERPQFRGDPGEGALADVVWCCCLERARALPCW